MDLREHLVLWIQKAVGGCAQHWAELIADELVAHGVTVLEPERCWIGVNEKLPDDSTEVNLCTISGVVGTGFYNKYTKNWVQHYSGGALCVDVTHWMPLPEPPKDG